MKKLKSGGFFDGNRGCPVNVGDVYKSAGDMFPYYQIVEAEAEGSFMIKHVGTNEEFPLYKYGQELLNKEFLGNINENPDLINLDSSDKTELSRHPHIEKDDLEDDAEKFVSEEENKVDFTSKTISDDDEKIEENLEVEETKEMSYSEARDYVDEEIDEKFMDDVTPEKMTPEKATKKIKELIEINEKCKERIEELLPIRNINNLDILRDLVKEQIIKAVEDIEGVDAKENAKTAKEGIRGLESISYVESLISISLREYHSKKQTIQDNERKIVELKNNGYQPSLFEDIEEESETGAETSEENNSISTKSNEEEVIQNNLAEEIEDVEESVEELIEEETEDEVLEEV